MQLAAIVPGVSGFSDPGASGHAYPRTFLINSARDVSQLSKWDWVVSFPWMNVAGYHRLNPKGVAMTYVRLDSPAAIGSGHSPVTGKKNRCPARCMSRFWHESSINVTYQEWSNSQFPGVQEKNSIESWAGGTDVLSDGQAANVGYLRPWNKSTDRAGWDPAGTSSGTTAHSWALHNSSTADLVSRLMVYAAKKDRVYAAGWDGVWSDNVVCANSSRAYCDGVNRVISFMRFSLPRKSVGGNGSASGASASLSTAPVLPMAAGLALIQRAISRWRTRI